MPVNHSFKMVALMLLLGMSVTVDVEAQQTQRTTMHRLTEADMGNLEPGDALAAVSRLRPQWLRPRGASGGAVRVFIDGMPAGGTEALRALPTNGIQRMEFVGGTEATQRWGPDHGAGVITIHLHRRGRRS
jgi:hypothetical protein